MRRTTNDPCGTPWTTTHYFSNIPLDEDKYDGNRDGLEEHFQDGASPSLRYHYLKMEQIDEPCSDAGYQTLYLEEFEGDELDLNRWTTSPHGDPYAWGPIQAPTWFHPDFVRVANDELTIKIEGMLINDNNINYPASYQWTDREGNEYYDTRYSLTGWVMTDTPNSNPGGCLQYGRYSIRAKLPNPAVGEAWSAFWFFGNAGEIDQFEYCLSDCDEMRFSYHAWYSLDCDSSNVKHYRDYLWNIPDCDANENHIRYTSTGGMPPDPFNAFNVYTLEWTPYKLVWYINDQEVYSFYRYYRITPNCSSQLSFATKEPLECSDIEKGVPLDDVYETKTWNRLREQYIDLILNGTHRGDNKPLIDAEYVIDWVKFEHRVGDVKIEGPEQICNDLISTFTYELDWGQIPPASIQWNVSSNLDIVSQTDSELVVSPNAFGDAAVTAAFPYAGNCFGGRISKDIMVSPPLEDLVAINVQPLGMACCYQFVVDIIPTATYQEFVWNINGVDYVTTAPILVECFSIGEGAVNVLASVHGRDDCAQTPALLANFEVYEFCSGDLDDSYRINLSPNPALNDVEFALTPNLESGYWDKLDPSSIRSGDIIKEFTRRNNSSSISVSLRNSSFMEIDSRVLSAGQESAKFDLSRQLPGEYYITTAVGNG
ncbi:MAG: family 16 glycosylhydrolase, partial [Bacteroidota bacterium]